MAPPVRSDFLPGFTGMMIFSRQPNQLTLNPVRGFDHDSQTKNHTDNKDNTAKRHQNRFPQHGQTALASLDSCSFRKSSIQQLIAAQLHFPPVQYSFPPNRRYYSKFYQIPFPRYPHDEYGQRCIAIHSGKRRRSNPMCSILKRDLNLISPSQLFNSLILDRNTQLTNYLNKRISIGILTKS